MRCGTWNATLASELAKYNLDLDLADDNTFFFVNRNTNHNL